MIRLFIGWDSRETVAWHVLAHSIITRSTEPVSITPIGNSVLPGTDWYRQPGEHDSTEFSNARFMVPKLCNYEDWAIFMDCDMLCQADIADLWAQRDPERAVLVRKHEVRKHDHQVEDGEPKFLGAHQTAYGRKNWSSLMLINCRHPKWATFDPNDAAGLDMHRFGNRRDQGRLESPVVRWLIPAARGALGVAPAGALYRGRALARLGQIPRGRGLVRRVF
jgi:hypothetical protein